MPNSGGLGASRRRSWFTKPFSSPATPPAASPLSNTRSGSGSGGGTLPRSASSSGALNMLVRKSLSLPRRRAGSASAVGLDIATDPTDLMLTVPDTPVSR
ncbi:hypothetical protein AMAG_18870 [Allomyces macrogynus ATCC 38327]|uniref:Uncharacterized protein n=1 Tax=Allomyces macrogynus (strain ATCC 38327) TaxID=578462 RepID=A0A0L0SJ29_ALLM3|nr:hypothetical protein AMAG_18870 [Allomyces macrogynus ATCC 38327]|eukprot:KNE62496.1 hypothetical protein AMAG_18870 [Allomyces macrogynus ATCC 38327]